MTGHGVPVWLYPGESPTEWGGAPDEVDTHAIPHVAYPVAIDRARTAVIEALRNALNPEIIDGTDTATRVALAYIIALDYLDALTSSGEASE